MYFPKIIWTYALRELWRVILLSAIVLVTVISFTLTVRHTAEGKLGPLETLQFMLYVIPVMLQYALPFAAGFGATIAYHRMTQDNEITAAAASAVSHRTMLAPALITGIVMSSVLWYLAGTTIPKLAKTMEQMVTLDATKILVNSIRAGRPVEFAGKQVHARSVYQVDPPKGAIDRLVLSDLSVLDIDDGGKVTAEVFAKRAWLTFYRSDALESDDPGASSGQTLTMISMNLDGSQGYKADTGFFAADSGGIVHSIMGQFRNDPRFMTTRELRELPSHPDRYGDINSARRALAVRVAEIQSMRTIDASLRKVRQVKMTDREGRIYVIHAGSLTRTEKRWEFSPPAPGRDIEVERSFPATGGREAPGTRFVAKTAGLSSDADRGEAVRELSLSLAMENASGQSLDKSVEPDGSETVGARSELKYGGLRVAESSLQELLKLPSPRLLEEITRLGFQDDPTVGPGATDLRNRIAGLERNAFSKKHERLANVAACFLMVLTGAVTALRLGSSLPLAVYLWSFFPAVLSILTISAGQQATRNIGLGGLFVMWGGVAALATYTGAAYWIARRH